jgi:diguanylate cyclase (GGDEF)-like protein
LSRGSLQACAAAADTEVVAPATGPSRLPRRSRLAPFAAASAILVAAAGAGLAAGLEPFATDGRGVATTLAFGLAALWASLLAVAALTTRTFRRLADEHARQALHDPLTGLANRTLFADRLARTLAASRRSHTSFALMLVDLDRFKEINDTLGHEAGDRFLREVAPRMGTVLREVDSIARLGGDEFGVLLPGVADADAARVVAAKIRTVLRRPAVLDGRPLEVGASIGIALFPEHGVDTETLTRRADAAMYAAKERRTGVEVFDPAREGPAAPLGARG